MPNHEPLVFFLALFGLYSPIAWLAAYPPIVHPYSHPLLRTPRQRPRQCRWHLLSV